jgi:site-specific DNA recombinase
MSKLNYVLYARKSTESEDKQVQSLEAQQIQMRKLAKTLGLNIVEEFVESKSAKSPFNRPEFDRMIRTIEHGNANAILTWQINRLSRNPAESGLLQQMLQDEKIKCIQTHEKAYNPNDNAVVYSVEASISNQFVRDLRKNVMRGVAEKARNGGISGRAPQGYLNNRLLKTIEPDPERFDAVKKIFTMCLQGYSINEIRRSMHEIGYLMPKYTKVGNRPLYNSVIHSILTNPRYAGLVPDPFDKGVFHKANYVPMITETEYDAVQRKLGAKGKPRMCASKSFALKGLLRCGECGCMITASEKFKALKDGSRKSYIYYHCTRKRPCSQKRCIREEDLLKQINSLLEQYELSPSLYEWGMGALKELASEEIKFRDDIQSLNFKAEQEIQKQIDVLLDFAARGIISSEKYLEKSKPLEAELQSRQSNTEEVSERTRNWYEFVGKTLEAMAESRMNFANGDRIKKNDIIAALGKNPVLTDQKLSLTSYEWVEPIKKGIKELTPSENEVRTSDLLIENNLKSTKNTVWYTRQDSNLWPSAPQADALSS